MEAKIYIPELNEDVTFTARVYRLNGPMAKHPQYSLDDLQWEYEKYFREENEIIGNYIDKAVTELFESLILNTAKSKI